jgi:hypothetical protein
VQADAEIDGTDVAVRCGHEIVAAAEIQDCNGEYIKTNMQLLPVQDGTGKIVLFARIYGPAGFSDEAGCKEDSVVFSLFGLLKSVVNGYDGISLLKARMLASIPHPKAYIVADNNLPDCPIVWCSTQFYETFGYDASECLGKTFKFLQGPGKTVVRKFTSTKDHG